MVLVSMSTFGTNAADEGKRTIGMQLKHRSPPGPGVEQRPPYFLAVMAVVMTENLKAVPLGRPEVPLSMH